MQLVQPRIQVGPRFGAISTLLVGDSGVGKTSQAAQWPQPVVFNLERGTDMLSGALPIYDVGEHFTTMAELQALIEELTRAISRKEASYKTLMFDGLTRFVRNEAERRSNENTLLLYRDISLRMANMLDTVLGAGVLVVATGHTRRRTVVESDTYYGIEIVPDFSQAVADSIMQLFDMVLYCYFDSNSNRKALTTTTVQQRKKREKIGSTWATVTYQYTIRAKTRGNAFRERTIPLSASSILTSLRDWGKEEYNEARARREAEQELTQKDAEAVGSDTATGGDPA